MKIIYNLSSIEDTKKIAKILSLHLSNVIILLSGDIGSGKTTFSSFFINFLSNKNQLVTSPTFPIVQSYYTNIGLVYHLDLYRIENENELMNLGIDEILQTTCLIEWSEKMGSYKPKHFVEINFYTISETSRILEITFSKKYAELLKNIEQEIKNLNVI